MDQIKTQELQKLAKQYFQIASAHLDQSTELNENLKKAILNTLSRDGSEVPGFEEKPMRFGKFENRNFVVLMTDIRKSTEIINSENGLINMFLVFYIYAGIVAKIVDSHNGTSTEFLGDGVLNLFDTKDIGIPNALMNSMGAAWEILEARNTVLNPFFSSIGLPQINFGIGIDHGITIVTRFGYRNDTDLKAFGKCVYNVSKLSKGLNEIIVSGNSKDIWPTTSGGQLRFGSPVYIDNKIAYYTSKSV
jgi:adenylate cyclase